MAKISSTAEIDSVRIKEAAAPATPASGYFQIYAKTDGKLYTKNDAGTEVCISDLGGGSGIPNSGWIDKTSETWTYASADDPTFTFTISGDLTGTYQAGQRIKLTQTTVKYFIITAVSYSAPNTTVTVYGGTDYDLANAAISANYYSPVKAPFGFPLDPSKWTVEASDTTQRTQATPVQNTWYNLGPLSLSIPIGIWRVLYEVTPQFADATATQWQIFTTLSTANNSESDVDFTAAFSAGNVANGYASLFREKVINLASKTSYYLNTRTNTANLDNLYNRNDNSKAFIRAVCAYL